MNMMQRVGLFVVLVCLLAVLVAHSPWNGYVTEIPGLTYPTLPQADTDPRPLPILEWRSEGALFVWFVSLKNVFVSVAVLALALIAWLYLFRSLR